LVTTFALAPTRERTDVGAEVDLGRSHPVGELAQLGRGIPVEHEQPAAAVLELVA